MRDLYTGEVIDDRGKSWLGYQPAESWSLAISLNDPRYYGLGTDPTSGLRFRKVENIGYRTRKKRSR